MDLFLLGHTHGVVTVACGFGVMASDTMSPEAAQPSVGPDLLQSLHVFRKFVVQITGQDWAIIFLHACLFKNLLPGILYRRGFCVMVITRPTSSSLSSPALLVRLVSAFLDTI